MLIVLTGPASAGKDTILLRLLAAYPNLKRVITTTTRQKRPGEVEGRDYYFISRSQFEEKIKRGEFLEFVDFSGNLYGTYKRELEPMTKGQDLIWRVETSRAAKINEILPPGAKAVVIYIDSPDLEVLKNRMRKRGMSEEEISQRLQKDMEDLQNYRSAFTHIIFNREGEIDKTIDEIRGILTKVSH